MISRTVIALPFLHAKAVYCVSAISASETQRRSGDDRRREQGADRGGQRVQAPDQHGLALDLGVSERRAFLLMAVDPLLRGVDFHECQRHDRDQPGPRHETRVIKRCVHPDRIMRQSHLRGVLPRRATEVSATPIVQAQRAPLHRHTHTSRIHAVIEA